MHSDFFLNKMPIQSTPLMEKAVSKSVAAMSKSRRKI
jgi:hypothetical protein